MMPGCKTYSLKDLLHSLMIMCIRRSDPLMLIFIIIVFSHDGINWISLTVSEEEDESSSSSSWWNQQWHHVHHYVNMIFSSSSQIGSGQSSVATEWEDPISSQVDRKREEEEGEKSLEFQRIPGICSQVPGLWLQQDFFTCLHPDANPRSPIQRHSFASLIFFMPAPHGKNMWIWNERLQPEVKYIYIYLILCHLIRISKCDLFGFLCLSSDTTLMIPHPWNLQNTFPSPGPWSLCWWHTIVDISGLSCIIDCSFYFPFRSWYFLPWIKILWSVPRSDCRRLTFTDTRPNQSAS